MDDDEEYRLILAARERLAAVRKFERVYKPWLTREEIMSKLPDYSWNMLRRWQLIYGRAILKP